MNNIKVISANNKELKFSISIKDNTLNIVLDDVIIKEDQKSVDNNMPIKPEDVKNVNKAVFQFFTPNDNCPDDACKKLKAAYLKELEILTQNPATCTSCAKGALNRKYIPLVKRFYEVGE